MITILILMFFAHLVDDYFLQSCLANLKQKKYWQENAPQSLYKYDYIMALICHSLMWSISISIPLIIYGYFVWWLVPINMIIHAIVDDLKANRFKINLCIDQSIHFIQVVLTWALCCYWLV